MSTIPLFVFGIPRPHKAPEAPALLSSQINVVASGAFGGDGDDWARRRLGRTGAKSTRFATDEIAQGGGVAADVHILLSWIPDAGAWSGSTLLRSLLRRLRRVGHDLIDGVC